MPCVYVCDLFLFDTCLHTSLHTSASRLHFTPLLHTASSQVVTIRAWEVARTVVAPPSSVVKCLWEVFVWGFGVLFLSCVCVCVGIGGVVLCRCVCVCVCDRLICSHLLFTPPLFTGGDQIGHWARRVVHGRPLHRRLFKKPITHVCTSLHTACSHLRFTPPLHQW